VKKSYRKNHIYIFCWKNGIRTNFSG